MMKKQGSVFFAAIALVIPMLSGCFIETETHRECYQRPVEVCDTERIYDVLSVTDVERCYMAYEEYCEEVSRNVDKQCTRNHDCTRRGLGDVCVNGMCKYGYNLKPNNNNQTPGTTQKGNAGLCQSCNVISDCAEAGSICTILNNSNEQVCTRDCSRAPNDPNICPVGFTCTTWTDAVQGNLAQCLPNNRSCSQTTPNACRDRNDCRGSDVCHKGQCVPHQSIYVENCTEDNQCRGGEVCDKAEKRCKAVECTSVSGCIKGSSCVNNVCTALCNSDRDCYNSERCVNQTCIKADLVVCNSHAHCKNGEDCLDGRCAQRCNTGSDCPNIYSVCRQGYCMNW